MDPFLSDILEGVVNRVNNTFAARSEDPFTVFFEKGNYWQVNTALDKEVYKNNMFPLIWFIHPYDVDRTDVALYGVARLRFYILCPTEYSWSQQQREDVSYKTRLLPVYNAFMQELAREGWFSFPTPRVSHKVTFRPYWGGMEANTTSAPNMFKKNVDALTVEGVTLPIRLRNCRTGDYSLLPSTDYPVYQGDTLVFRNDLELIVGGGASDPVSGESTILIPSLFGWDYTVIQRVFGPLREEREAEVTKLPEGGFTLQAGYLFNTGDTYFIKIKPKVQETTTGLIGTKQKIQSVFIEK